MELLFTTPSQVIDPRRLKFLFQKELKNSDVSPLRRMILPKKAAEAHLPVLDSKDGILLTWMTWMACTFGDSNTGFSLITSGVFGCSSLAFHWKSGPSDLPGLIGGAGLKVMMLLVIVMYSIWIDISGLQ